MFWLTRAPSPGDKISLTCENKRLIPWDPPVLQLFTNCLFRINLVTTQIILRNCEKRFRNPRFSHRLEISWFPNWNQRWNINPVPRSGDPGRLKSKLSCANGEWEHRRALFSGRLTHDVSFQAFWSLPSREKNCSLSDKTHDIRLKEIANIP